MRRLTIWLILGGLTVGLTAPAWGGWTWRDGRWELTDDREPQVAPPDRSESEAAPKAEPPPKSPPPAPSEPPAQAPPATQPPALPKTTETGEGFKPQRSTVLAPWWVQWRLPKDDKMYFDEGRAALTAGDQRSAAKRFKTLIKKFPASRYREEAMWLRAEALFAQKDYYAAFEQYEELLTQYAGSPHYRDALLREIDIAELFLGPMRRRVLWIFSTSGETEAIEMLRRTYEHQPTGDLADNIILRIADYYWSKSQWAEAEEYYDKYCREYPNGEAILRAELKRAKCTIEKCRGPRYDIDGLQLAYDRLHQYEAKFPEAAEQEGVGALMVKVRDAQAESLYEIAARYHRANEVLAAAFYAERLRARFPDTTWSEKAKAFLADSAQAKQEPNP